MKKSNSPDTAKAIVRRNTEEVQEKGNLDVFDELFSDNFIDHTPQPGTTPDKAGVRKLYTYLRAALSGFSCRDPLAACRWRSSDDVQNVPWHP